jgi:hypothetical protein
MYHDDPGVPTAKPDLGDLRALLELAAQSTIPASGVRYPLLFSIMDDEANTELNEHVDRFDHFAQDNGVYNFATNP